MKYKIMCVLCCIMLFSGCDAANGIIDIVQEAYPADDDVNNIIDTMQKEYFNEEFANEMLGHVDEIKQGVGALGGALEEIGVIPEGATATTDHALQEAIAALREMELQGWIEPGTVDELLSSTDRVEGKEFRIEKYALPEYLKENAEE